MRQLDEAMPSNTTASKVGTLADYRQLLTRVNLCRLTLIWIHCRERPPFVEVFQEIPASRQQYQCRQIQNLERLLQSQRNLLCSAIDHIVKKAESINKQSLRCQGLRREDKSQSMIVLRRDSLHHRNGLGTRKFTGSKQRSLMDLLSHQGAPVPLSQFQMD